MNLSHEINSSNCPNLLNLDFSDGFLSSFENQLHIGLPYPIHKPSRNTKIDIIRQFHTNQTLQNDQLSEVSEEFRSAKDTIMSQSFEESHVQIPKNLLDYCNNKCKRESVPFPCDYNPFHGSCLECFSLNNVDYLIRPDHRGTLRITNLTEPYKCSKLYLNNTENGLKRHITGISHKDSFLLLRLGNEINLIEVLHLEDIQEVKWKKKLKKNILDAQYNNGTLGLISASLKLRLYNIETNVKLDLGQDCNIGSVKRLEFIDSNNVGLLGQTDFKLIDLRAQSSKVFEPEVKCVLCSMKIDNNTVYLASRNQLIHTDIRFFKNVEFCSHLMTKSPCYIDLITTSDNMKWLCLANQADEKVLFNGNSFIDSLPMFVPNICDTLAECQLTRDVLLKDQLDARLDKSTFGIKLHRSNDELFLHSANCLGDIFQQKISERSENNREAISNLEKWISELPPTKKKLHLTNLKNLSHLRFTLNKEPMHERLVHFRKGNRRAKLFLAHFQNVYNKNTVGNLVANFMAPWEEEEEGEEREPVDLVPEVAPIEKVNSWIQSSYFFE